MLTMLIALLALALINIVVLLLGRRTRRPVRPQSSALFHSRVHAAPLDFGEWQPSAGDQIRNFSNRR